MRGVVIKQRDAWDQAARGDSKPSIYRCFPTLTGLWVCSTIHMEQWAGRSANSAALVTSLGDPTSLLNTTPSAREHAVHEARCRERPPQMSVRSAAARIARTQMPSTTETSGS